MEYTEELMSYLKGMTLLTRGLRLPLRDYESRTEVIAWQLTHGWLLFDLHSIDSFTVSK